MTTVEPIRRPGNSYRNLDIVFALVIAAAAIGFYKTYSAGITFSGKAVTTLINVHTALMVLWLLMLVGQAWLVRTKRLRLHRLVGRSSLVVVPLIIVATLIAAHENLNREPEGITVEVARLEMFTWGQLIGFGGAWALAMLYRRRTPIHVRFMVSTLFAIGSAIIARIFISWIPGFQTPNAAIAGNCAVLLLALLGLIALDWRRGIRCSPFWFVTIVIAMLHLGYWTFGRSDWWVAFVQWFAGG